MKQTSYIPLVLILLFVSGCASEQKLAWPLGARALKAGMKGNDIVQLHHELHRHGCLTQAEHDVPVLHKFIRSTEDAVKCFQQKAGLPVTGRADPATIVLLKAPQNTHTP